VRYIKETPKNIPLFLYTAYTAAHWPLHALPEDIEKQKGRYAMGWDRLRQQRLERMKKIGIVKPDTPLSPRHPNVPAWKDEKHKQWQQRRMEVYAAQITRMDKGIGRILNTLKETNRLENTLIMVLVDNGGCHVEYNQSRTGAFLNKQTRDGQEIKTGNRPDVMPGAEDTWQSYGYGWANASNTPFRMFKQYDHEGGICVPLIVQWPKIISKGGQITRGQRIDPADGKSMVPILRGKQRKSHEVLFWKFSHGCAVRQGKWKLVRMDKEPWELYNIEADPVELNNLNRKYPEKAAQLAALWEKWYKSSASKKPSEKKNRK
jgi:arylsulfatase